MLGATIFEVLRGAGVANGTGEWTHVEKVEKTV